MVPAVIGRSAASKKAQVATAHGCDHAIIYTRDDFIAAVNGITGKDKVPVVYDSVDKDTFMKSVDWIVSKCLM
jgi:NADPH:quinone reductase